MKKARQETDAFGVELMDFWRGNEGTEVVERSDGYVDATAGPAIYFSEYADWHRQEKQAFKHVRGRVLDIGTGAGRHALYLQSKGHDVTGIDTSPLALKVCKLRGLKKVKRIGIADVPKTRLGKFDTLLMLGNNFGLFESKARARGLLREFLKITSEDGRIIAQCIDPYQTANPAHLAYHRMNRAKGRMGGQLRMRVRYKAACSQWFDYLFVSPMEMMELLCGTGWYAAHFSVPEEGMFTTIIKRVGGG